jgi:hypothetical protein
VKGSARFSESPHQQVQIILLKKEVSGSRKIDQIMVDAAIEPLRAATEAAEKAAAEATRRAAAAASRKAATEAWWRSINEQTADSYDGCVGEEQQKSDAEGPLPHLRPSWRAIGRLFQAVFLLLANIFRPYFLLLAPLLYFAPASSSSGSRIRTIIADHPIFTSSTTATTIILTADHASLLLAGLYVLVLLSELRPRLLGRFSPRTDGAWGQGAHGAAAPLGWSYDARNALLGRLQSLLSAGGRADYEAQATPWLLGATGDLATLFPFLCHTLFLPRHPYVRRWLPVPVCDGPSERFLAQRWGKKSAAAAATATSSPGKRAMHMKLVRSGEAVAIGKFVRVVFHENRNGLTGAPRFRRPRRCLLR